MANKTITIKESQLRSIIEESIENALFEKSLIMEMALPMKDFSDKLHSKIWNVFTNLACICIYHDAEKPTLVHWAERATEPFQPWFSQDIVKETPKKRTTAVNKAFSMMYNEDYSAIGVDSFQNIITYYANRPNINMRVVASNKAQFYYDTYKGVIVSLLETMRNALIKRDYSLWFNKVSEFYTKYMDDK